VSLDTDVATPDTRARVYLRVERFNLIARTLGFQTTEATSRFVGISRRQVDRACKGDRVVGEGFIAAVLTAFAPHEAALRKLGIGVRFEDLFEIRNKEVAA
jgi:hypothetical protein